MNKKIIWILLVILFIFSVFIIHQRINVEKKYNNVELILDYDELFKKCAFTGHDFRETLLAFKEEGITTIAFNEETLEGLKDYGKIYISSDENILKSLSNKSSEKELAQAPSLYLLINKEKSYMLNKINNYLPDLITNLYRLQNGAYVAQFNAVYSDVSNYGLGFNLKAIEEVSKLGFNVILRPKNKVNLTEEVLKNYWKEIFDIQKKLNGYFSGIIFGGIENEALGYPSMLSISSGEIKKINGLLGVVEVGQQEKAQKGIAYLASKNSQKVVRVMSISDLYLAKLNPEKVIEKYTLGVRERNIRWVYIHLFNTPFEDDDVITTNLNFVGSLSDELKSGFNLERPNPLPNIEYNFGYIALVIFIFIYLLYFVISVPVNLPVDAKGSAKAAMAALLAVVIFAILFFIKQAFAVKLLTVFSLLNSILFVVLAFKIGIDYFNERLEIMNKNLFADLKIILTAFFIISFISFTGGVTLAVLLFKEEFLLNIYQFMGVKLLMILPPVLVFYWYIVTQGKKNSKEIFGWPVTWGQAVLLLMLMAAGVYYIMRTGNLGEGTALEAEKTFRSYLSNMLVVRPRLKEILFAHPALILALAFIKNKKNYILCALFILFGAIGQADIIDTFAHAHTPVVISLIRFGYGLLFGIIMGIIYYLVYKLFWKEKN